MDGVATAGGVEGSELKLQRPGLFFPVTQEANWHAFAGRDRPNELVQGSHVADPFSSNTDDHIPGPQSGSLGHAGWPDLPHEDAGGTRGKSVAEISMPPEVVLNVGAEDTQRGPPRAAIPFGKSTESNLVETDNHFILGRDNRDTLLPAATDHLHSRGRVLAHILGVEWNIVTAKELLSTIAPWSGTSSIDRNGSRHNARSSFSHDADVIYCVTLRPISRPEAMIHHFSSDHHPSNKRGADTPPSPES